MGNASLCYRPVVRFYGADLPLCDRDSEHVLVQQLSERGFGPRVLRAFPGGRVEEFWDHNRRPLRPDEVMNTVTVMTGPLGERRCVDFAVLVAIRLAELHSLGLEIVGRRTHEQQLDDWLTAVEKYSPRRINTSADPFAEEHHSANESIADDLECVDHDLPINPSLLRLEFENLEDLRPAPSSESEKLVRDFLLHREVCHLDLFASNLFHNDAPAAGGGTPLDFIDYEYAADAPVGLDIANHFSGCTEKIDFPAKGQVTFDAAGLYPSEQQCLKFLRVYTEERISRSSLSKGVGSTNASSFRGVMHVLRENVEAQGFAFRLLLSFAAEAELRWVVWALLQSQLSTVEFDFLDYARQRWAAYGVYRVNDLLTPVSRYTP